MDDNVIVVGKRSSEYTHRDTGEVRRWEEIHVIHVSPMESDNDGTVADGQAVEVFPLPRSVPFGSIQVGATYTLIFTLRVTRDGRRAYLTGLERVDITKDG